MQQKFLVAKVVPATLPANFESIGRIRNPTMEEIIDFPAIFLEFLEIATPTNGGDF